MIRIIVDTEDEISEVRHVLKDLACDHCSCPPDSSCSYPDSCSSCVENYFEDKVQLIKREIVEEPIRIMV